MSESDSRRLDIWDAVSEGLSLAASRNGLVLIAVFYLLEAITVLLIVAGGALYLPLDQAADVVGEQSGLPVGTELSLVASGGAILLASAFGVLVSTPVSIIAIRSFVVGATDRIPEDCLFHRLGRATLSALLATVVITLGTFVIFLGGPLVILLGAGFLFEGILAIAWIVLGLLAILLGFVLLWLHFLFVTHEIAVRDQGVVGAFRGSWATVRGNRLRVFVLAVLVTAVQGGVGWTTAPAFQSEMGPLSLAGLAVGLVLTATFSVAATAVLARAYRQLSPDDAVRTDSIDE